MRKIWGIIIIFAVCLSACGKDEEPAAVPSLALQVTSQTQTTTEPTTQHWVVQAGSNVPKAGLTEYGKQEKAREETAETVLTEETTEVYQLHSLHNTDYWWKELSARELCVEISDGFINKDHEKIKSFFCERARNEHDLDKEINDVFNAIGGNIISYDHSPDDYLMQAGGYSFREGGMTENCISTTIEELKADNGKTYEIIYELTSTGPYANEIGVQDMVVLEVTGEYERKELGTIGEYYGGESE